MIDQVASAGPLEAGQLGLFDGEQTAFDRTFTTARRTRLDAGSWVEFVPGWLVGTRDVFSTLLHSAHWEQRDRWMYDQMVLEPRLTAQYPDVAGAPQPLPEIASVLSQHYGLVYYGVWLNLYRDNRDSTSWHGDTGARRREEAIVAVLSLGSARRFLLRPRAGGRSTTLIPASGDLVVMGGRCQRDWQHCVPKQSQSAAARISVNFQSTPASDAEPG
jgi:alkylated DNA repair dioxygenase AlkB